MNIKQNQYIIITICKLIIMFVALFFQYVFNAEETVLGVIVLICTIWYVIKLIKDKLLVTPLILAEFLYFTFGLYKLHFVNTMIKMNIETSIIILLSIFTWEMICMFNSNIFKFHKIAVIKWVKGDSNLKYTIIITFTVCALLILLEWIIAGGIPVLQKNMEMFRFNVVFSSTLHVIAMCMKYVPFLIIIYCKFDIKYLLKKQLLMSFILVGSIAFLIGTAFRGELMISFCLIALAYFIYKKPKLKTLIVIGVMFGSIMAIYPVIRSFVFYGNNYIMSMKEISTYPDIWFLTPLYQTFASNFHYLNRDIGTFPSIIDFGLGKYTFLSNIPFLDGIESLADAQNRAWNNGFYAKLTATIFGSWYADFGYIGFFLAMITLGVICNYFFNRFARKKNVKSMVLYLFIFYKGIQMIYDNTFDFVAVLYLLYLWLVFSVRYVSNKSIKVE